MARYIDADKVHESIETLQIALESNNDRIWAKNKPYYKGLATARAVLDETPTADVVPRAEVAREIFEEIEKYMMDSVDVTHTAYKTIGTSTFAILKKKYTEGEK